MPPIRSASVLLPTRQGAGTLERVLAALARQECGIPWDVRVVDAGSTDGTLEILERARAGFPVPLVVRSIHEQELDAGDTRNLLAAGSTGELCVFLSQDAVPASPRWLADLARNFEDPLVGAVGCRRVTGPEADRLTRVLAAQDPACSPDRREVRMPPRWRYARLDAGERRRLYVYSDLAGALRRELWELHPFPRTPYGEDVLMGRALLEAGYTLVHDPAAAVEHGSHLTPDELRARARLEGLFQAEWLEGPPLKSETEARELVLEHLARDEEGLREGGASGEVLERELARARELREAWAQGLLEGGLSAQRRSSTAMLASGRLHVLYVVHGFPPDTWAGTEVYTLELAREMQRLGHQVTILARAPADRSVEDGGPEDFSLVEGEFQGLSVWRMVHRLQHTELSQSYSEPRAEEAFRNLLVRLRPDLVHFQHLIHTSVGLVEVAREEGLPTLLHCHDFWPLCARVQMIRPDRVRCEENQGAGCFLCIRERGVRHVSRLRAIGTTHMEALEQRALGRRRGELMPERRMRFWEGLDAVLGRQERMHAAIAAADLRVSPSRFLRGKLVEGGGLDPNGVVFSDNGMRTDHVAVLKKARSEERRLRVGFVGSLVWYKGPDVLVRAMELLCSEPVQLDLHGDFKPEGDPFHAQLRELAAGLPSVRFRGRFENQRLSEVYAELDVLVVPSVWFENAPITIREAFLTGTPVVTSALGGMAESVRDGVDGLHFAPGDPADLARVLRRLLDEAGLLERLARGAPAVKTVEENARETEFRYRGMLARTHGREWPLLLSYEHDEHAAGEGDVDPQGAHLTLVRHGGAVEYDLAPARPGRRLVEIELLALGCDPSARIGGRASLDGRPLGPLGAPAPAGEDVLRFVRLDLDLVPGAAGRLRLEALEGEEQERLQLPIRRVSVYGLPSPAYFARSPHLPPRLAARPTPAPHTVP